MVEKLKSLLGKIIAEKGAVTLFAIMRMDDLTDKWSVIFSAPWVTTESKDADFSYIVTKLNEGLSEEESASIARVGIFAKDHHIPQLFLRYKADQKIVDEKVNGFAVHEAYILASNPE